MLMMVTMCKTGDIGEPTILAIDGQERAWNSIVDDDGITISRSCEEGPLAQTIASGPKGVEGISTCSKAGSFLGCYNCHCSTTLVFSKEGFMSHQSRQSSYTCCSAGKSQSTFLEALRTYNIYIYICGRAPLAYGNQFCRNIPRGRSQPAKRRPVVSSIYLRSR